MRLGRLVRQASLQPYATGPVSPMLGRSTRNSPCTGGR